MININAIAEKRKKLLMGVVGGFLALVFIMYLFSSDGEQRTKGREQKHEPTHSEVEIKSIKDEISEDAIWRHQMKLENQLREKTLNKRLDKTNQSLESLSGAIESIREKSSNPLIGALGPALNSEDEQGGQNSHDDRRDPFMGGGEYRQESLMAPTLMAPTPIIRHHLNLKSAPNLKPEARIFRTTDTIIPATTFVKAVLLSGVDASTAIQSSADPVPVTIRLRDDGHIPRKLRSDLKGCHVLGAAKGNLSSERVHIRLEKLVCTEVRTKEIIETDVSGYVVGPDGKNGIRGEVISQEGRYLGRAAVGGILSGFASVLNPQNAFSLGPQSLIGEVPKQGKSDLFKKGLSGSVSSSSDRLAQYYIDRAEQIQPVISVPGGVDVEIVFTASVDIGSSNVKKHLAKARDKRREEDLKELWDGHH